jgi:hypothetical protein
MVIFHSKMLLYQRVPQKNWYPQKKGSNSVSSHLVIPVDRQHLVFDVSYPMFSVAYRKALGTYQQQSVSQ